MNIRPATVSDCRALGLITVSASLGAFLGHIPEEDLDLTWTPEQSASGWRNVVTQVQSGDGEFFDVAEHDGQVVAFVWAGALTGRNDFERYVSGLYVLPTMQRRGIGRQLLRHSASTLHAMSVDSLLIGCIRENPSCSFYERLGGVEVLRRPRAVDNFETEEIFFGWTSLEQLK